MINTSKIYKMRVVFCVSEDGPNRSETLDAVRTMVLHSGLNYMPAKTNAHWPRLSYGPLVGRGQTARREYIDIYLRKFVSVQDVRKHLEQSKPQGVHLIDVKRVPYSLASLQQLATAAVYTIEGEFASFKPKQTIEEQIAQTRFDAQQQTSNGMHFTTDLHPFVRSARSLGEQRIELTLVPVAEKWMNPLVCVYAWLGIEITGPLETLTDERFKIIREGLYWQDGAGDLHPI